MIHSSNDPLSPCHMPCNAAVWLNFDESRFYFRNHQGIGPDSLTEFNSTLRCAEKRRFTVQRALKEVGVSDVLHV